MKALDRTKVRTKKTVKGSSLSTKLLDDVSRCLTPAVARRIVELRADSETQARVEELAEKCNEGQLTPNELAEYESYVSTSTFVAILQAKARAVLAQHAKQ